ncbi:MAG: hypothetical protein FWC15_02420 [Fibromonadales bacterium]|nr:hypothetical protein [Fibromonadales bacterium]
MAKKTYPIATKALAEPESEVIDAEATVVKKSRKKKTVEKKEEPKLTGWAYKKETFGVLKSTKYTISLICDPKTMKGLGYIVSTYGCTNNPNAYEIKASRPIFPTRPTKKPFEIFFIPLDFDFGSFFGDPHEFVGACGYFDPADLPEYIELPEFMQIEAIKADFEIIKDKLKTLSHSKFKRPKAAAIETLKLIGSLEEKMYEEVKPVAIGVGIKKSE